MRNAEKVLPYALAALLVVLAIALKGTIDRIAEQDATPFLFFWSAVALAAWYGGLRPGLAALALSGIAARAIYLRPESGMLYPGLVLWIRLGLFVIEASVICAICEAMHRARRAAELERAQARRALRARRSSEARFRRLAESNILGVIAGRGTRIFEANEAFLAMLGIGRDGFAIDGLDVAAITPPEYDEQDVRLFDELFRAGTLAPFEKEYRGPDGRRVPVLVGGALIEPGSPEWVAFVLDLSRQKGVERDLAEATARAQEASRSKSEFLANISHELITPMNAVLGMNELALAEERNPAVRDHLLTARGSAEALLALLRDLLDFASIEAGGFVLERRPFGLRSTIEEVVGPLRETAAAKGIDLICDVPEDVPDALIGDPRRLRQVLVNLVDNAVKFTASGGVALSITPAPMSEAPLVLAFEVVDTGIGIDPGHLDRIFEPFTQIDASSTRPYSGTGLGLAICRRVADKMGAVLEIDSEPGRGTRFRFEVGFGVADDVPPDVGASDRQAASPAPGIAAPPTVAARPLRILLAEDTPANQRLATTILGRRGHAVDVAGNGREAVELAGRRRYDLVLMDLSMPVMDGFQATAAIRSLVGGASSPDVTILALTAHAMRGDRERCLRAGMDGYLTKPIDVDSFLSSVEAFAARLEVAGPDGRPPAASDDGRRPREEVPLDEPIYDRTASLKRLGGSEELFRDLIGFFMEDAPGLLEQLRAGLLNDDAAAVERAAHSLKGLVANCGGLPASTAAARVETIGREGRLAEAPESVERLVAELDRLREALRAELGQMGDGHEGSTG